MPRHYCCVNTCKSTNFKGSESNVRFIKFPQDTELRERWREVIGRGPDFTISQNTRICSKHFRSGKRSLNPASEDYVPSVFEHEANYTKKSYCRSCRKIRCICHFRARQAEVAEPEMASRKRNMEDEEDSAPDDGEVEDEEDQEWSPGEEEEVVPKKRGRGRPPAANVSRAGRARKPTPKVAATPPPAKRQTVTATPKNVSPPPAAATPKPKSTPSTPAPASNNNNTPVKLAAQPVANEAKLLKKIQDLKEEQSRKLEVMSRTHNMTVANLKEEFQQKLHTFRVEYEEEKTKLWEQIEILNQALAQRSHNNINF